MSEFRVSSFVFRVKFQISSIEPGLQYHCGSAVKAAAVNVPSSQGKRQGAKSAKPARTAQVFISSDFIILARHFGLSPVVGRGGAAGADSSLGAGACGASVKAMDNAAHNRLLQSALTVEYADSNANGVRPHADDALFNGVIGVTVGVLVEACKVKQAPVGCTSSRRRKQLRDVVTVFGSIRDENISSPSLDLGPARHIPTL